jgi:hypothetical protein
MLQVLVATCQNLCCKKETWGYAKVILIKKKEKELRKKWTSARDIKNNGYLDAHLK